MLPNLFIEYPDNVDPITASRRQVPSRADLSVREL